MTTISMTGLARTQAFVLAGGQGERLLPLTMSRPKPAISFGVSRIIDFTLSNCLQSKLAQVALLTQYRHDELHRYIGQRWNAFWNEPGRSDRHLICLPPTSGKRYRGTADAVFQNLPTIRLNAPEHLIILSGDHVYEMDYRQLLAQHVDTNADVTIATIEHPVNEATHFGVVEVDKDLRVIGFEEKPEKPRAMPRRPHMALISMGVYVFRKEVLVRSLIENCDSAFRFDFGHHVIPSLIGCSRVYAYDFHDNVLNSPRYWRDIGTIDSYYAASMDLAHGTTPLPAPPSENCASISAKARVSHSVLSAGVRVEEDVCVEDSVVMPGARVGRHARIRRAIIGEGVNIPPDFEVGFDIERDRKHHTVSRHGVVVVSETPAARKPVVVHFQSDAISQHVRTVA
jgi:glucose-1-phosphate adenylyltransferase